MDVKQEGPDLLNIFLDGLKNYEHDPEDLRSHFKHQFSQFAELCSQQSFSPPSTYSIHIAGSKGKGSNALLIRSILDSAGISTGLYISPHLFYANERIQLNGIPASESELLEQAEQLKKIVPKKLSWFEFITLLAFRYFKMKNPQVIIYETGLGGRLDATNVITPNLCILTTIEKEHISVLGPSLELIASEKCGIIKPGIPVLTQKQTPEVMEVIRRKTEQTHSFLFKEDEHFSAEDFLPCEFKYYDRLRNFQQAVRTSVSGPVQKRNYALSLFASVFYLSDYSSVHWVDLKNLRLPGRFEYHAPSSCLFDLAHTPVSVNELIKALNLCFPRIECSYVLSLFQDKDWKKILALISASNPVEIYYHAPDLQRGLEFSAVISEFPFVKPFSWKIKNPGLIVFTGGRSVASLYKNFIHE